MSNTTKKDFSSLKDIAVHKEISLKQRVQILLFRKGMSQNQLADEVGISTQTISKIVRGDWIPTSRIKLLMAKILECDSLVLFGGNGYWIEWREKIGYPEKENQKKFTDKDAEKELNEVLGEDEKRKNF